MKCLKCGKDTPYSATSSLCPECKPVRGPKPTKTNAKAVGGLFVVALVAFLLVKACSSSPGTRTAQSSSPAPAASLLMDGEALDKRFDIQGNSQCSSQADGYLKHASKYNFKWDETGFLEHKFDKFLPVVLGPGVLTYLSDKVSLENGFGAYQRVTLECDYDTQHDKVLAYRIQLRH